MMAPQPDSPLLIYVVIVNYNRAGDTLECLESLARQNMPGTAFLQAPRILVVDNGSHDGSPEKVEAAFPEVEQLRLSTNLGFAGGYNTGIRYALEKGAGWVFILNNDTVLAQDCLHMILTQALEASQPQAQTGILAPIIYEFPRAPEAFDEQCALTQPRIWSAGGKLNPLTLEKDDHYSGQIDPGNWPPLVRRDFVTGCAMLISEQALEQVGMFDENFHLYYEDADLCLRISQAGHKIFLVPAARLWHKVASSSGGRDSPQERYWMARSSIRYFSRHARFFQVPFILVWRTASALRTTYRLGTAKNWPALKAYWLGLRDGLRPEKAARG
jgi:GT2 family glycosyltransferase